MSVEVPGARGSLLHQTAEELYHRHAPGADRRCSFCGHPATCPTRDHAARVLAAVGAAFTGESCEAEIVEAGRSPAASVVEETSGFGWTGRARPLPEAGYDYVRLPE